jgi:hypothetical protein
VAVGAINNADAILNVSSRGPTTCGRVASTTFPDLTAPGVNVRSSDLFGLYATATGTSLAAPHVSGVLALLASAFPGASASQLRTAIGASAVDLGSAGADNTFGTGRLSAPGAYAWLAAQQPPPDQIFADGFESGGFQAWSQTAGTNLAVTQRAALSGAYGLEATLSGTSASYVTDDSPTAETTYRTRFDFDPNAVSLKNGTEHVLVARAAAGTTSFRVEVRRKSPGYRIRLVVPLSTGGTAAGPWVDVNDAPHALEVLWTASATSAQNGSARLWIDGASAADLSGLANASARVDLVRLGIVQATVGSGTQYFDRFASTRGTPITL